MNVKIVSEAKADFANLLTYYVNVGNYEGNYDLARRFEAEILQAFSFIKEFPNASKLLYKNHFQFLWSMNKKVTVSWFFQFMTKEGILIFSKTE